MANNEVHKYVHRQIVAVEKNPSDHGFVGRFKIRGEGRQKNVVGIAKTKQTTLVDPYYCNAQDRCLPPPPTGLAVFQSRPAATPDRRRRAMPSFRWPSRCGRRHRCCLGPPFSQRENNRQGGKTDRTRERRSSILSRWD